MTKPKEKPGLRPGAKKRESVRRNKDRTKPYQTKNQFQATKNAFAGKSKTMLMVARITGIERANVCRFVSMMERKGQIYFVRFGLCSVSNHRAGYYTTSNPTSL
jgi:hypothetical protein